MWWTRLSHSYLHHHTLTLPSHSHPSLSLSPISHSKFHDPHTSRPTFILLTSLSLTLSLSPNFSFTFFSFMVPCLHHHHHHQHSPRASLFSLSRSFTLPFFTFLSHLSYIFPRFPSYSRLFPGRLDIIHTSGQTFPERNVKPKYYMKPCSIS